MVSCVRLTGRRLAFSLLVLAVTSAILVTSPSNISVVAAGLVLYTIILLLLLVHCEKTASIRELRSVLLLVVFSSSLGVLVGVFISPTLLSAITAASISILLLVYALFSTRWYE